MSSWDQDTPGVVTFADGTRIRGTGVRHVRDGAPDPDFALYLLGRRPAPRAWESRWVRWPDFRTPAEPDDAVAALQEALARAQHERVEIACAGGNGRTGTALALIAALTGTPSEDAVYWVRQNYQPRAVETMWQRRWVRTTADELLA